MIHACLLCSLCTNGVFDYLKKLANFKNWQTLFTEETKMTKSSVFSISSEKESEEGCTNSGT